MVYKGYLVPSAFGENFPYSVLYRSSIYNEVKSKIETLNPFVSSELGFDIEQFLVECK